MTLLRRVYELFKQSRTCFCQGSPSFFMSMSRARIMASQLSQLLVITENLYGNDWGADVFLWHHARFVI